MRCRLAKEAGVDVLDISRGNMITAGLKYEVPPIDIPKGFNVDNCARIRRETGMLCIAVGRINTPQLAEEILEQNKADMLLWDVRSLPMRLLRKGEGRQTAGNRILHWL